jgi:hypothetical protein
MLVYALFSEWDFGQDEYVFKTEQAAYDWLKTNSAFNEMLAGDRQDTPSQTLENYIEDGFFITYTKEVL